MTAKPLLIGCHCSAAGGAFNALAEGAEIGCTTIQLFTANQRTWNTKQISKEAVARWYEVQEETGIREVMSHDSYLINLGSPQDEGLARSRHAFRQEIERCLALGITYLNFHPGAALDSTLEECLDRIVASLLSFRKLLEKSSLVLCLEATAGQGSSVGHMFEHLAYIINGVKDDLNIGVTIDTCHIFAAGYDISTADGWRKTLHEFDELVGLKYLRAFHINDSVYGLGSRRDRHASLGKGKIGLESFKFLMTSPKTRTIPKYLETPNGPEVYAQEIALLREMAKHH